MVYCKIRNLLKLVDLNDLEAVYQYLVGTYII